MIICFITVLVERFICVQTKPITPNTLHPAHSSQVLPLELASKYAHFASPPMGPSDFDAKPLVLILGEILVVWCDVV